MTTNDEERLLEVLAPLIRPGTLLQRIPCESEQTMTLQGGSGGSCVGGVPYLESGEAWPVCTHGAPMRLLFQVDGRDALHRPAFVGLYVVYGCAAPIAPERRFDEMRRGHVCRPEVRYYDSPTSSRRLSGAANRVPSMVGGAAWRLVAVEARSFLPDESLIDLILPEPLRQRVMELGLGEPWERVYCRLLSGSRVLLFEEHLGGWHQSYSDRRYMPPDCASCAQRPEQVAQLEAGDWWWSLWTCDRHPAQAHFAVHK